MPGSVDLNIAMDRSPVIRATLHEAERTLLIAVGLVIVLVFLFRPPAHRTDPAGGAGVAGGHLRRHVPVRFFAQRAVADGIDPGRRAGGDDAIVVLENIARHIDDGMPPLKAAYVGTREVGFTLLSMNLSLVVVFVSILYMGGIVERLFREFSITLAAAILVSLLVSLTLTPDALRPLAQTARTGEGRRLQRWSHDAHQWLLRYYDRSLSWALRHRRITLLSLLATIALNVVLYVQVPKTFCRSRTPDRSPVSSAVTTVCRSRSCSRRWKSSARQSSPTRRWKAWPASSAGRAASTMPS